MKMTRSALIGAGLMLGLPLVAGAQPMPQRTDQQAALEARMRGRILPLREIEARVVPGMRGAQYIGFDFDSGTAIYTLKFLRNGTVIWVDVDGRSGRVLSRTGK
jgi:uncharacterized membrane protein YkoI